MSKKKTTNQTPRTNVGVPEPWHAIFRRIAAKREQPLTYVLVSLLKAEAERLELGDLPPTPWEEDLPPAPAPTRKRGKPSEGE